MTHSLPAPRLTELLAVPADSRISELERLRRPPTRVSGRSMTEALHRASELSGLGTNAVDVAAVPANRLEALARDGLSAKAQAIERREPQRRTATLVAAVRSLSASAVDDALDVFAALMADKLIKAAERTSREAKLASLPDTRFWRIDPAADYGPANDLARHRIRLGRISPHWPEMLRIAGSLVTGTVAAYDLIRALGRDGNPTPLGQAFAEYGRIAKTQHLLAVADPDDDTYQRSLNTQLNTTESRHRLARKLCFGYRGELRQSYQEGMEDQLGALGLVLNAVVLWNTTYLNAAIEQLRTQGYPVTDADAARPSPLIDTHLNVHGAYTFVLPQLTGLRPLRDPATAGEGDGT